MSDQGELFLWLAKASGPIRLRERLRRETRALQQSSQGSVLSWRVLSRFTPSVTGEALVVLAGRHLEAYLPGEEPPASDGWEQVKSGREFPGALPGQTSLRAGWVAAGNAPPGGGRGGLPTLAGKGTGRSRAGTSSSGAILLEQRLAEYFAGTGSARPGGGREGYPALVGYGAGRFPREAGASGTALLERPVAEYFAAPASAPLPAEAPIPQVSPQPPAPPGFVLGRPANWQRPPFPAHAAPGMSGRSRPETAALVAAQQISDRLNGFVSGTAPTAAQSRPHPPLPAQEPAETQNIFNIHVYPQSDGAAPLADLPEQMAAILREQAIQHGIDLT